MRVYVDTNVFVYAAGGGDPLPQRRRDSRSLVRLARRGLLESVVSPLTVVEIKETPDRVLRRRTVRWLRLSRARVLPLEWGNCVDVIATTYKKRGAVPLSQGEDAEHLAWATLGHVHVLASWNRTHLVRLKTRRLIGMINPALGYPTIDVEFPSEVIRGIQGT